jgi:hypothetical protein
METISDIVKIKTGYANFVELKSSFEQDQENLERMAMYRPTTSHRRAFERLCRGLFYPTDKKFYLLTGSYGTGKSHLCLMLANFLSRSSGDPEVSGFYDNYEKLDPDQGKTLRNLRKNGQYLVAICDYNSGQSFEDVVFKAVFEACESRGIESLVQTRFDEAERLLSDWEKKSGDADSLRNFYEDFNTSLEKIAPAITIDQLREGLRDYDSTMLDTFTSSYSLAQGGTQFQYQSGNLNPILKKLVKSEGFKSRFKGLAILFDEFGFTLEKANYSKDILQGFMEKICQNEPNIMFVGCIHKSFAAYADRFSKADAAVMTARITHVNLLNEGIEEIIGAIVETDKGSKLWQDNIEHKLGVLDTMLPMCETLQLFPWIKETKRIREKVLEDIYGIHPAALSCLLKLSSEIGSDARSTFTFFTGDIDNSPGSYARFIQNAPLTINGGRLNLYTVPWLHKFFCKELDPKNSELRDQQRELVNAYETSELTFRKNKQAEGELFPTEDDPHILILKIIFIFQLCKIPSNADNLFFGFYGLNAEKKLFTKQLKKLDKAGAIFYRRQSKTYDLAAANSEDPYDLIERYLEDTEKYPDDIVQAFIEESGEKNKFLEARQYNLTYNEDKRFYRVFKQAKDLEPELWKNLLVEMEEAGKNCNNSYEGVAVYSLCEEQADIKVARDAVVTIPDHRIVVSIPHNPQPFRDALLKVKACRYYLKAGEVEKLNPQTEIRFRDIFENVQDGLLPGLKKIMQQVVDGGTSCWYGKGGNIIVDMAPQSHKPADLMCEKLFNSRCRIKHPDLNQVHNNKWKNGRNTALKQAVNMLLHNSAVQIDNGNPDNHGEKKYLERVLFLKAGALNKIRSEETSIFFECESREDKISNDFPILKELCNRLNSLGSGKTFQVTAFIKEARNSPWGSSETALMLALAHAVAAFGERLRIYKDSTKMVEQSLDEYNLLEKVLSDPASKLVFEIKEISIVQEGLIEKISSTVHAKKLLYGEKRSLTSACDMLKSWWKSLPMIAKVKTIYDKDDQSKVEAVKKNLDKMSSLDRYDILFGLIPEIYGELQVNESDSEEKIKNIAELFEKDVKLLESGMNRVQNQVSSAIAEIFGSKGDMVQCEKIVKNWFENLNPDQRDSTRYDGSPDAQNFITQMADSMTSFSKKILEKIPDIFELGPVKDWGVLHIDDYVSKLTQAKKEIEAATVIVPLPETKVNDKCNQLSKEKWEVGDGGSMKIALVEGIKNVVYTIDGSDPRNSLTNTKVSENLILDGIFADKSAVQIKARGIDESGNYSDMITCSVVNKTKEYQLNVEKDSLFKQKGTFKVPDSLTALKTVLSSIIDQALKDKVINDDQVLKFKNIFKDL